MLGGLIQNLSVEESLVQGTELSGPSGILTVLQGDGLFELPFSESIVTKNFHPIILYS